jgi:hypothetical protein
MVARLVCPRRASPTQRHRYRDTASGRIASAFFCDLAESAEESLIPYDVDIVDPGSAALGLIDEVRREGVKWKG